MHTTTDDTGCVAVIGEFDGMHLGHQQVLHVGRQVAARSNRPLVGVVVDDRSKRAQCQSVAERCRSLLGAGARAAVSLSVDRLPADAETVARTVVDQLDPHHAVLACRSGRPATISPFGDRLRALGLDVTYTDLALDPTLREVSSARLRQSLATGDVTAAAAMLGRPFELRGEVVHGRGLGRTIGFATANLALDARQALPALGVYAAETVLDDGRRFAAAVNVGVRPTIDSDGVEIVEAHLLDFDGDLYDTTISVRFSRRLRAEQQFDGLDALVAQLQRDIDNVRLTRAV